MVGARFSRPMQNILSVNPLHPAPLLSKVVGWGGTAAPPKPTNRGALYVKFSGGTVSFVNPIFCERGKPL